ncbi:MAG: AAA family ATPase [Halobacteriaceae archaeon]
MAVIGTVGLPGSGKGEFAAVAEEAGVPVVVMGDIIREETADRGLDPKEDHGEVAQTLREENGPGAIAERSLPAIRAKLADHETVVVDGIRSGAEVDRFQAAFGESFCLVSIEAPFELRAERVGLRGRDVTDGDGESLRERDDRELGFGMGDAMSRADITIENTGTLAAFRDRAREIIAEADP